ncbi:hypothetical protein KKF61_03200 [Patescibacteria group bacterium]|nr:hypothetical protein [Patescibacteria group bacterium]MBU0964249.1 hypothetical protein [Patescibacteria group bacterium]
MSEIKTVDGLNVIGTIYVFTHGDKAADANPGMLYHGFCQVESLKPHLPPDPTTILCGTGRRHWDVAIALGLTTSSLTFTSVVGRPESSTEDGKIMLPNGIVIEFANYDLTGFKEALLALFNSLTSTVVICAGRPCLKYLGIKEAQSAAMYKITGNTVELVATAGGETGTTEV